LILILDVALCPFSNSSINILKIVNSVKISRIYETIKVSPSNLLIEKFGLNAMKNMSNNPKNVIKAIQ
jgi:hypothetical protein